MTGFSREAPRDPLPLPCMAPPGRPKCRLGRRSMQRVGRREAVHSAFAGTVGALNALYMGTHRPPALLEPGRVSASQQLIFEHIAQSIDSLGGPPVELTSAAALRELRGPGQYLVGPVAAAAPYQEELLSWPAEGSHPVALATLWGDGGLEKVGSFLTNELLPAPVAAERVGQSTLKKPHWDPRLLSRKRYTSFINQMRSRGLVDFRADIKQQVGVFCVSKKSGKLRLIIDARLANLHFSDPASLGLCTGAGLSSIELGEESVLHIGHADLQDAFYHFQLPELLRPYFGLRPVRAGDVGVTVLDDGTPVAEGDWVYPTLCVVPMGWSWAMWWCQAIHERLVASAGESDAKLLSDRSPVVGRDVDTNVVYADNFLSFSTVAGVTSEVIDRVSATLTAAGMVVHEVERETEDTEVLGWLFEKGHVIRPTRRRVWRCRLAIRAILAQGRVSGRVLEKLVGHLTFVSLLRRESLAVLSSVYAFIRRSYDAETVLWDSVRRELSMWDGLAPLIWVDLRMPWHDEVAMVDASHWGLGVVSARAPVEMVASTGRWSERWRFSEQERASVTVAAEKALAAAMEDEIDVRVAAPATGDLEGAAPCGPGGAIPEVPEELLARPWKLATSRRWARHEHINALESKAILFAIRRALRAKAAFGRRILILSDNMVSVNVFSRGRSSAKGICSSTRSGASLLLASGSTLFVRWVSTHRNWADGPSRGIPQPSIIKGNEVIRCVSRSRPSRSDAFSHSPDLSGARANSASLRSAGGADGGTVADGGGEAAGGDAQAEAGALAGEEETSATHGGRKSGSGDHSGDGGGLRSINTIDILTEGVGDAGGGSAVSRRVPPPPGLGPVVGLPVAHRGGGRGEGAALLRGALRRGRARVNGGLCAGCASAFRSQVQRPGQLRAAAVPPGIEGVASQEAGRLSASPTVGGSGTPRQLDGAAASMGGGGGPADHVPGVLSPRRAFQVASSGRGASGGRLKRSPLGAHLAPLGARGRVQDQGLRRDVDHRLARVSGLGGGVGPFEGGPGPGPAFVPVAGGSILEHYAGGSGGPRPRSSYQSGRPLPAAARRRLFRHRRREAHPRRSGAEGPLEDGGECAPLREGRASWAVAKPAPHPSPVSRPSLRGADRRRCPWLEAAFGPRQPRQVVVDVSPAPGRLAAVARQHGVAAVHWRQDAGGPRDLADEAVVRLLLGWLTSGRVAVLHCQPDPRVPRQCSACFRLARVAARMSVPVSIVGLAAAPFWDEAFARRLVQLSCADAVWMDLRVFGGRRAWATRLVTLGVDLRGVVARGAHGSLAGLAGAAPGSVARTAGAPPDDSLALHVLPLPLTSILWRCLQEARAARVAAVFGRVI